MRLHEGGVIWAGPLVSIGAEARSGEWQAAPCGWHRCVQRRPARVDTTTYGAPIVCHVQGIYHNHPGRQDLSPLPSFRGAIWGLERLNNLPWVTHQNQAWTQAHLTLEWAHWVRGVFRGLWGRRQRQAVNWASTKNQAQRIISLKPPKHSGGMVVEDMILDCLVLFFENQPSSSLMYSVKLPLFSSLSG